MTQSTFKCEVGKKNWNEKEGRNEKEGCWIEKIKNKTNFPWWSPGLLLQYKSNNNVHYLSRDGFKTISCSIWWAWSHVEHVLTNLFHCVSRQNNTWLQCSFLVHTKFETTTKLPASYKNNQFTLLGEKCLINMFLLHKIKIINSC